MALTYGFYNSLDGDRKYNAKQFGSIFDGVIHDGVYINIGERMIVKASGNGMQVNIQPGRAWFNHTWTLNDTIYPIVLPASEPLLPKYVAVVLEINENLSIRANSFKVVSGTPARNPSYPTLTNNSTVHQYPLAYILINAGVTAITQSSIRNMVGTSSCPYVTSVAASMNIDELVARWESQWNDMINSETNTFNNLMSQFNNEWSTFYVTTSTTWSNYFADVQREWASFAGTAQSTWNTWFDSTQLGWNQYFNQTKTTWTDFLAQKNTAWNTFLTEKESEFQEAVSGWDQFVTSARRDWSTFMQTSDTDFHSFLEAKDDEFHEEIDVMEQEYGSFWTDFKRGMDEYLAAQKAVWQEWFNHIKGQLSEDAATHLQDQIDSMFWVYVAGKRAVLGTTASIHQNKVILNPWYSVAGSRITLSQPAPTP